MTEVVSAVEMLLKENLGAGQVDIVAEQKSPGEATLDTGAFFAGVMERSCEMFQSAEPDVDFTACVAPIFIQYRNGTQNAFYNLIAIAARSAHGREWLLSQFIGNKLIPRPLVTYLATQINGILERRGALQPDASEIELGQATSLVTLLAAGVDYAVEKHAGQIEYKA